MEFLLLDQFYSNFNETFHGFLQYWENLETTYPVIALVGVYIVLWDYFSSDFFCQLDVAVVFVVVVEVVVVVSTMKWFIFGVIFFCVIASGEVFTRHCSDHGKSSDFCRIMFRLRLDNQHTFLCKYVCK